MFCFHVSKFRWIVHSNQLVGDRTIGSPSPAASRTAPPANSGTSPSPFDFQRVSAISAGASDTAKSAAWRQRRAMRNASAGPARKSAFAGLSASAAPANVPASTASR